MLDSLEKLSAMPDDTRVYCAHEYTLANLKFASAVEPGNDDLQQRIARDTAKREQAIPTVPSLLSHEKATNPFLRCDVSSVIDTAQQKKGGICRDPVEVFATIRSWKDNF
jgi:hydroxyacylglutathione hydrolase